MVLTPAGERLMESGRSILGALARAEQEARKVASDADSVLRFATECYTCYHWLPATLIEYRRMFPRVEPRIVAGATRRPLQALLKGQLDLAVVTAPVRDRRVALTPLFTDEFCAVVAPDHPWAGRPFVVAEDFADEHVFLYNITRAESTLLSDVLDPAKVAPKRISRVELTEAILELVRAGLGVATLARWSVAPYVRSGALVTVSITRKGLHRRWSAATLANRETPEHLGAFVELLARIGDPNHAGVGWRPPEPAHSGARNGRGRGRPRAGSVA